MGNEMKYNTINIGDILNRLNRYQLDNIRLLHQRKDQIYEEIPRIYEIDQEISSSSLSSAKARILAEDAESLPSISELRQKNRELSEEKRSLLKQHGYPADYLEMQYHCSLCQDTGYVNRKPCSCLKQMLIDEMYQQSNLKNILEQENFDTFSLDYYSKEAADGEYVSPYENMSNIRDRLIQFTEEFDQKHENIVIYGETGLGKTFLTNCVAKKLLDSGHTVLYLSANELFESILSRFLMSGKKNEDMAAIYDYIYQCDLLILDDLGTEMTNNFILSQLFEIVNQRILSGHSTMISTNLDMKTMRDRYTERVMSRLIADYIFLFVYGKNIRYLKRKAMLDRANELKQN